MGLSVGIITFNEEKRLERTLESVRSFANEVIIVDSGSTDKTHEIAQKFSANFFVESWKGYGLQKNSVIDKCKEDWILLIDADEVISPELKNKIIEIVNQSKDDVYEVNFTSVCFGKKIKHGGWSGSYRIRLWKKNLVKVNENLVHEDYLTEEKIGFIKEQINHYSYLTLEDYLNRFNRYTTLGAQEYYKRGKNTGIFSIIVNPIFKFIRMYVFRLGFLDGIEGLLLAILSSNYTMVKYYKLLEMNRRDKNGN